MILKPRLGGARGRPQRRFGADGAPSLQPPVVRLAKACAVTPLAAVLDATYTLGLSHSNLQCSGLVRTRRRPCQVRRVRNLYHPILGRATTLVPAIVIADAGAFAARSIGRR